MLYNKLTFSQSRVVSIDKVFTFKDLYLAYQRCLKGKRKTHNAIAYQMYALDKLYGQWQDLQSGQYKPSSAVSFITTRPKAREIIAADFSDRIIHHWLVNKLEPLFEPIFIFDLYSNRKNKGTHKAVKRLQGFMHASVALQHSSCLDINSANLGYFLQLDIKNFFNCIDHRILLNQLGKRLEKCISKKQISKDLARQCYVLARTIIQYPVAKCANYRNSLKQRAQVPAHKQLGNAPQGKGLPIGNLTSQFFANVYMNDLDQFVKHTLKCKHYVRYVDDFVLLHSNPQELLLWRMRIVDFLASNLDLRLKNLPEPTLNYLGADFLGFIVRPYYKLVRHRVAHHCVQKLQEFANAHIRRLNDKNCYLFEMHASDEHLAMLRSILASYWGHFRHASSLSVISWVLAQHTWLKVLFKFTHNKFYVRYENRTLNRFCTQCHYFRCTYMNAGIYVRCGYAYKYWPAMQATPKTDIDLCIKEVRVEQYAYLKQGLCHRVATHFIFSLKTNLSFIPITSSD